MEIDKIIIPCYPLSPIVLFTHIILLLSWLIQNALVLVSFIFHIFAHTNNAHVDLEAMICTITTKILLDTRLLHRNPSFWKMKLGLFHTFAISHYIWHSITSWCKKEANILFWSLINPNTFTFGAAIYWTSIIGTVATMLRNELVHSFRSRLNQSLTLKTRSIKLGPYYQDIPLPKDLMVLSNIMLFMSVVGEAIRHGAQWTPFTAALQKRGNTAFTSKTNLHKKGMIKLSSRWNALLCIALIFQIAIVTTAHKVAHANHGNLFSTIRHDRNQRRTKGSKPPSSSTWTRLDDTAAPLRTNHTLHQNQPSRTPLSNCTDSCTKRVLKHSHDRIQSNILVKNFVRIVEVRRRSIMHRYLHSLALITRKHLTLGHNDKSNTNTRDIIPTISFPQSFPKKTLCAPFHDHESSLISALWHSPTPPSRDRTLSHFCFTTHIIALSSSATDTNNAFQFVPVTTEFGTDNCATQHICGVKELFVTMNPTTTAIGVKGISGTSMAEGMGTVRFTLKDDAQVVHNITLENVIYLPGAIKNLISISQWSRDKGDNCAILSRGTYSIFCWNQDKNTKTIEHAIGCAIPMMVVNDHHSSFACFANTHAATFDATEPITMDGSMTKYIATNADDLNDSCPDQQPNAQSDSTSASEPAQPFCTGDTVRANINNERTIAIITKVNVTRNGRHTFRVRRINSNKEFTVSAASLRQIQPDPSDFPSSESEVDREQLTHILTSEEIGQLWSPSSDNTVTPESRLTLYWHHRLRCAPLRTLHRLSRRGVLPKCIQRVRLMPLCASCAFATAHRKSWRHKNQDPSHIRKLSHKGPGDGTSCDHIISHQPGLIPQITGRLTHERYWGSVIYVDHFSDYVYNHLITAVTSEATLLSKQAYERMAQSHDVKIRAYHADNLRFNDSNFTSDCNRSGQSLTFCGVGAHHQNAIAEAKVKLVCHGARTILLHAQRRWPSVISHVLWPFAIQAIIDRHNKLSLDDQGRSPLEKFAKVRGLTLPTHFHTFGCPVFILDAPNQTGSIGTPKWRPRSHTGIYLGHSPCHASSVALVLNLKTGLISPQYHIVYDDEFTTVKYLESLTPPPHWEHLVRTAFEKRSDLSDKISSSWLFPSEPSPRSPNKPSTDEDIPPQRQKPTTSTTDSRRVTFLDTGEQQPPQPNHLSTTTPPNLREPVSILRTPESAGEEDDHKSSSPFVRLESIGLRRSPRIAALPPRRTSYGLIAMAMSAIAQTCTPVVDLTAKCFQTRVIHYNDYLDRHLDGTPNSIGPFAEAYLSSRNDNEVYTLKQMLQQPDREHFIEAMRDEIKSMFSMKIWKRVPKREMLDHFHQQRRQGFEPKRPQIMTIWSFKRKRKPDGTLCKYKARLCCHGGQQQWGVNYWHTYAPVVTWSSIRILMTLANIHGMYTKSVDFVQAYPQAKVKSTIYLKTPQGIELNSSNGESVLKLERNLYGLKDAGRTWFEHLTQGLEAMGFAPTVGDPCVYTRGTNTIVLYVDDCIIISRTKEEAEQLFKQIEQQGFAMTDEGTMEQYLGMQIEKNNNGSFTISQPFLIDRIISAVPSMNNARSAKSPAATGTILTKDEEGEPRKESWHYRSVIGMLNYLVNCTHPELAYSVHQCARFCNLPKHSHEQAVKRIIRYLLHVKRSSKQGITFKPDASHSIDTFVDASFAGEWNRGWSEDPSSVFSRTGYVIMFSKCPIIWGSKLQSEITLSTTESEYVAFSQALRDVIPLIGLLRELRSVFPFDERAPVVHCTVHEDNKGCIDLVETPRIRPRTKHIALKYHHFRSYVKDGTISVKYVETSEQIADIFTKPLGDVQFAVLREKFMGW